jgi:prephenate dehydratase
MSKRVAVLGPKGTNGHEAASRFMAGEDVEYVFCKKNEDIFPAVLLEKAEYGVVPIYNSSKGLIEKVKHFWMMQDARFDERGIYPIMETSLLIKHCLLVKPDFVEGTKIEKVFSHSEALGQCRNILEEKGVGDGESVSSTADAARLVSLSEAGAGVAAIASKFAAEIYGLKILQEDVHDNEGNETTFHLIGRKKTLLTSGCETAIMFWLKNETASLDGVINVISAARRNKSIIWPVPTGDKRNIGFYIEFDGHMEEEVIGHVLGLIKCITNRLIILGSFPELYA